MKRKPLAASSALIVEHKGEFWRLHLGHGQGSHTLVGASVYPAIGFVSLEKHIGVTK